MVENLKKLSALCILVLLGYVPKADSFLLSEAITPLSTSFSVAKDHIIPLIYIKDMEYYNHKTSPFYTQKIIDKLSLEPSVITTENRDMADYELVPRLLTSKIEPIDALNSRYSMALVVELITKDGTLIFSEPQNRYIIVENQQNMQKIARKLMQKLLDDAINALMLKIRNNHLNIS